MRRQPGKKVEVFKHRDLGGNIDIRLDTGTGRFNAVFGNTVFDTATMKEMKAQLEAAVVKQTKLEWLPVIIIHFGTRYSFNEEKAGLELHYDREWFAKLVDDTWIRAEWDTKVYSSRDERKFGELGDRLSNSRKLGITRYDRVARETVAVDFKIPYVEHDSDEDAEDEKQPPTYYIAHTEETWRMLESLAEAVRKLKAQIIKILGTESGRQQLVGQMIGRLLPPAPPTRSKK